MENNQTNTLDAEVDTNQPTSIQSPLNVVPNGVAASLEDFKSHFRNAEKGYVIKLPVCGLNVRVKTPDMINMLLKDKFPQDMINVALQLKNLAPKTPVNEMGATELKKMVQFVNEFFCAVAIEPQFTTDIANNPDMFDVDMLDIGDKLIVIELINRGVEALSQFRPVQKGKTDRPNGKKIR
jgi:hypothetical protein